MSEKKSTLMRSGARLFFSFGLLIALVLACPSARSQATQGSVIGVVKDAKGAVIPGAVVTLTNTDLGAVRTTKSAGNGDYSFTDAVSGHYTLTAEFPGFEKFEITNLTLEVRQQLRLDAQLSVGAVQQQVQVSGDAVSAIQTDTPTISGTFTADDANGLPVNTRASSSGTSAAAILGSLPGAQADPSGVSLQGALPFAMDVTVDGVTTKNAGGGTYINDAFPSTEGINEIRADGVMSNAEFGDPAQVVVTTKGGTNKFHGSAFVYYQDNNWNASPYSFTPYTKPSYHGTTFGGSFGGPVILPHYNGHGKSFFFVDYEGWRFPAQNVLSEVVPSTGMIQGDFSGYSDANGKPITLRDPNTGANCGTNLANCGLSINPIAAATLKQFYPAPNIGNPAIYVDNDVPNWTHNVDASAHSDQFDVRGDKYFGSNQKFLLWGRYSQKNFPVNSAEQLLVPSSQNVNTNKVLRVDTNWTISPNLINEGGYAFTRVWTGKTNPFNGNAWTNGEGFIGLQNLYFNGIPEMDFNNIQTLGVDRLTNLSNSLTGIYSDTLIWTKGRHTMKFGVDIQTLEAKSALGFNGADNYGTYYFNGGGNSVGVYTGIDFADFLTGIPNSTFYDIVSQDNDGVSQHYHAFAQDDWRVSENLTLSYGIRYELHPGYHDKGGDIGNFDPSLPLAGRSIYMKGFQSLLAQPFLQSANACDPDGVNNTNSAVVNGAPCMPVLNNEAAGYPIGLKKYPHLRFMPRFGVAYRPFGNDKTAIRAGFGMYNINLLGSNFYSLTGTLQAYTQQYNNNPTASCGGAPCKPTWTWPTVYAGSGGAAGVGSYGTGYFGTANSANWKDPYTEQWSLSIDRDLGQGYAVRASYIGSETHQLIWAPDENSLPFSTTLSAYNADYSQRLFPNWGRINNRMTGANESYHSAQLAATHRLQHGLEYNSTFTWAKALADNQGPSNNGFAGESGGSRATSVIDRAADFGDVFGTRRLRWNTTGLYDLPIGRGKQIGGGMSRIADTFIGGWRLTNIFTWQSGNYNMPYFPDGQGDPSGTGSGLDDSLEGWDPSHRTQYADQVSGVSWKTGARKRNQWVNPSAFTCPGDPSWTPGHGCYTGAGFNADGSQRQAFGPGSEHPLPIGRFGNARNGVVEGPGLVNLSSGLNKSFAITERFRLKIEGTFTNVLNHANLGDPNLNLSSGSFGVISGTLGSDFGGARTTQVAARFEF
ncbi:TonB-dependent receptor [Terracidiphilus gabretensis]|uniref:TonB-dependent receptor n=1 Tax=Terracidiphilus gabretensis TaxID=1577687 RepID=UPI00071BF1B4|nr:TonB-dependent receptor [Terracidiphilus gabretensis]